MRPVASSLLLLLVCVQPLSAHVIGEPIRVNLAEASTTVTLDFSDHDYELILYSTQTDVETSGFGIGHPFGFSVTAAYGDSDPVIAHNPGARRPTAVPDDVGVDFMLRKQERELARHLQQSGGYHPPTAKIVSQQIGSTRDFVFPGYACWIIENDTTITAVLYATSQRANAYVDVADTGRVSKEQRSRHKSTASAQGPIPRLHPHSEVNLTWITMAKSTSFTPT